MYSHNLNQKLVFLKTKSGSDSAKKTLELPPTSIGLASCESNLAEFSSGFHRNCDGLKTGTNPNNLKHF